MDLLVDNGNACSLGALCLVACEKRQVHHSLDGPRFEREPGQYLARPLGAKFVLASLDERILHITGGPT